MELLGGLSQGWGLGGEGGGTEVRLPPKHKQKLQTSDFHIVRTVHEAGDEGDV